MPIPDIPENNNILPNHPIYNQLTIIIYSLKSTMVQSQYWLKVDNGLKSTMVQTQTCLKVNYDLNSTLLRSEI